MNIGLRWGPRYLLNKWGARRRKWSCFQGGGKFPCSLFFTLNNLKQETPFSVNTITLHKNHTPGLCLFSILVVGRLLEAQSPRLLNSWFVWGWFECILIPILIMEHFLRGGDGWASILCGWYVSRVTALSVYPPVLSEGVVCGSRSCAQCFPVVRISERIAERWRPRTRRRPI